MVSVNDQWSQTKEWEEAKVGKEDTACSTDLQISSATEQNCILNETLEDGDKDTRVKGPLPK